MDRPHALLWLATTIPTIMYACQVWGARFMKKGREFDSPPHEGAWREKNHTVTGNIASV